MAHTVVGKLNKDATVFGTQSGTGFGVRVGVQYYDRDTKQKEWTNYEAVIFTSQSTQAQFYKDVLVAGSVIEISGESLKIKQFQGQNGMSLSLEIINARLGYVHAAQQQSQPRQQQPQQAYAATAPPQQQAPIYAQQPQQHPQQQIYAPQQPQQPAPQAHSPHGHTYNPGFAQSQQVNTPQPQPQQHASDDDIPFN